MKKRKNTPAFLASDEERQVRIAELEQEREGINDELRELLRRYAKLTGNKTVLRGVRRAGSAPNDYSFWRDR